MKTHRTYEVTFKVTLPYGGNSQTIIARLIKDGVFEALTRDRKKDPFINEVIVSQPKLELK